jgi:hypothetical protein
MRFQINFLKKRKKIRNASYVLIKLSYCIGLTFYSAEQERLLTLKQSSNWPYPVLFFMQPGWTQS